MIPGIIDSRPDVLAASIGWAIENGSNKPFYTAATFPMALYDASNDRTWMTYEGWGTGRSAFVTYYDHAADTYGPAVSFGEIPLTDDSHGMPAICQDADGYIHVFFGPHNGDMKYSVSGAPNSNLTFTAKSDISGDYTYPNPVCIGSAIYLFMRLQSGGNYPLVLRPITGITSGAGAVGSEIAIADPQGTDRFYIGPCFAIGSKIHLIGTISNNANTYRDDVYYLIYDTSDGSLKNHNESVSVASGSLPVTRTSLDADFRIVTTGGETGTQAGFCFDENGAPHVAWVDGANIRYMNKTSGSWSSPETVGATDTSELPLTLICTGGEAVELWFSSDPDGDWSVGGDMYRRCRTSGGAWGEAQVAIPAEGKALFHATPVVNGSPACRLMCDTVAQTDNNGDAGNLVYLRSDSGFVRRKVQGSATAGIVSAFSTPPSDARIITIDRAVYDLEQLGIWAKLDALWLLAAHEAAAAHVNWINPGTHDITLSGTPTFVADDYYETNGSSNYLDTNFNPATAGGNFTQNSAIFGIISGTAGAVTASSAGWYDGTDGITIRPYGSVSLGFAARINSASSYDSGVPTNGAGGYFANRSGSGAHQNYRNGTLHGAGTLASTALNSANLRLGSASAGSFAALRFRAAFAGGSLTATEVRQLYDVLTAYLQGVGAI